MNPPPKVPNAERRSREHLTPAEIDRLIAAAQRLGRHGQRDATMILLAYRHGLRVSELVGLRREQVDLRQGLLHVRRRKNGLPGTHPLRGPELRALREVLREYPDSAYVFISERDAPMTAATFRKLLARAGDTNPQTARAFQRLFTRLVTIGEGQEDTRRVVDRRELGDDVWSLAQALAGENNRLVVTNAPAFSRETAEVVHEALIRHWPRLVDWIGQDRAFLSWLRQIRSNVELWSSDPTDDGPLLRGAMLVQATEWLADRRDDLSPAEQGYIEASRASQRRAEEEREVARQAEFRRQQELAEAAVKLANEQRRRARIAVVGGIAAVCLALVAMAASFEAYTSKQEADANALIAFTAKQQADTNASAAREAAKQAQVERDKTSIQLLAIQARRTEVEADMQDDIARAAALALESVELAHKSNRPVEPDAIETVGSVLNRLPVAVLAHGSPVRSLAVLKDGRLASGGEDGKIKLWPKDGSGEPVVLAHGSPVRSLAVLADGRLASGGEDGVIKLWPTNGTGEPVMLRQGGGMVLSLAALADGRLASGDSDGTTQLWPGSGVGKPAVLSQGSPVDSLAVMADRRLASGDHDGTVKIWPKEGKGKPVVLSHGGEVQSLAVLPDGRLAGAGQDGSIKLWPREGAGEAVVLAQEDFPVYSLAVLADGRLVSGNLDGTIKLWPKAEISEPTVISQGGTTHILRKVGGGEPMVLWHSHSKANPGADRAVYSLAVLPDGRLASAGQDGTIKLWPKENTDQPLVLSPDSLSEGSPVYTLAVLADGRFASANVEGTIKLWPKDGPGEPVVLSHGDPIDSLAALPDGRLASGGFFGNITLWPTEGRGKPTVLEHGDHIRSLRVLADGRLASGGEDGKIKLWPKDGSSEPVVLSHGGPIRSLAVLADGRLASGGEDGEVKLWPKDDTGEPTVLSHGNLVFSLAALPDGRLASGGGDGKIKLWPKDARSEPTALAHGNTVLSLAILADGRLASGGEDGKIRLWPKDGAGEPVVLLHGSPVESLAMLSDGRLASGDVNGTIKLWLVDEQKLIAALCLRAGRNLTKDEWSDYIGSDTPWQPSCRDLPSNWRTPD